MPKKSRPSRKRRGLSRGVPGVPPREQVPWAPARARGRFNESGLWSYFASLAMLGLGAFLVSETGSGWWFVLTLPACWIALKWRWQFATDNQERLVAWWRRRGRGGRR